MAAGPTVLGTANDFPLQRLLQAQSRSWSGAERRRRKRRCCTSVETVPWGWSWLRLRRRCWMGLLAVLGACGQWRSLCQAQSLGALRADGGREAGRAGSEGFVAVSEWRVWPPSRICTLRWSGLEQLLGVRVAGRQPRGSGQGLRPGDRVCPSVLEVDLDREWEQMRACVQSGQAQVRGREALSYTHFDTSGQSRREHGRQSW